MPGAADGVVGDEAIDQRPTVMRAVGGYREYLGSAAQQKHRLASAMTDQLAAIGKIGERNAEGEVGSGRA